MKEAVHVKPVSVREESHHAPLHEHAEVHPVHDMASQSQKSVAQRALSDRIQQSPRMHSLREQTVQMHAEPGVVQRLVGAGAQPGLSHTLGAGATTLGEAALRIAQYINTRARTTAAGPVENSSQLGANNAGNLHVLCPFDEGAGAASLETWSEMTGVGGGYVKRVRITRPHQPVEDRVMHELPGTALQQALATDRHPGHGGLTGGERYASVHGVHALDANTLEVIGDSERTADNITKMVGEGARFGWLAAGLSAGTVGNTSTGVLNVQINVPQEGTFALNPTFQQLWGAWDSAFNRSYMKDKNEAKIILKQRLKAGWRRPNDNEVAGGSPLASGATAAAQITSLSNRAGGIALMPGNVGINGPGIVTDLGMKWTCLY